MADREKAIRVLGGRYANNAFRYNNELVTVKDVIALLEAQEPKVMVHGHWHQNDNGTYSCSRCNSWIPNEQHYYARYCLYCGALMDGGEDDA